MTPPLTQQVPFNALALNLAGMRAELDAALAGVLDSGYFLMGPSLARFETAFAAYHGVDVAAVGVGSGTDALSIGLRALGVEQGDEVLVAANAGVPPVAAVVAVGAIPVFCDVDPKTHTLDPREIDRCATTRSRAVLAVHLYGQVAQMPEILDRARSRGLLVLEDCAQAHGARLNGQLAGTFGDAAAFSFYPTKNLGALGDGGAILTTNHAVAERARMLRQYGWRTKYYSETHATVSRLDEVQAAVLSAKLPHLATWNTRRRELAEHYSERLRDVVVTPWHGGDREPVFHLYVVRTSQRDGLRGYLAEHGVASDIHYPLPAHLQPAYARFGTGAGSLPETERIADDILSLPMYPDLTPSQVTYVADQVRAFFRRGGTSNGLRHS